MINEQYARAKAILTEHKEGHNELAQMLIDKEVIFAEDVERIFGKRPWTSRAQEIIEANDEQKAKFEAEAAEWERRTKGAADSSADSASDSASASNNNGGEAHE